MKFNNVLYIVNDRSIVIHYNKGETFVIDSSHEEYEYARSLASEGKVDEFKNLVINILETLTEMSEEEFVIKDDKLFHNGVELRHSAAKLYIQQYNNGNGLDAIQNFIRNVSNNKHKRAAASSEELYDFLVNAGMPITADGCFYAYKYVKNDMYDSHTGTVLHEIGKKLPELSEGNFDTNRNNTCSAGYHFCAYDYLDSYVKSDFFKLLLVKVNPKDVVAIPVDYNNMKGRATTYTVVDEIVEIVPIKENITNGCTECELDIEDVETPSEDTAEDTSKLIEDKKSNHLVVTVSDKVVDLVNKNKYVEDIADTLGIKLESLKRRIRELRSKGSIPSDYTYNYKEKEK